VEKIRSLLTDLEGKLVCPFGIEDDPEDLSQFPCGHVVSLDAWQKYEKVNLGKKLRCPRCNAEVDYPGATLPMKDIRETISAVRDECKWLDEVSEWNGVQSGTDKKPAAGIDGFELSNGVTKSKRDTVSTKDCEVQTMPEQIPSSRVDVGTDPCEYLSQQNSAN
jgi:hypothetical protein